MKTLLLPFCDDDVSRNAFELATRIVQPDNGYVEGLFVLPRPPIIDGDTDGLDKSHFTRFEEECRRMADRCRATFEECAKAQGLAVTPLATAADTRLGWQEMDGSEAQVVGSRGRLFDLIVVGREFGRGWLEWGTIVESALFDSGRPLLLVPSTPCKTFGERVVIAWNSSTETARTVAQAMPLLARAKSVTVVSIEGWGTPGPGCEDLAMYLRRAGVPAGARSVVANGRAPGNIILEECIRCDADLLLKGAYTQSRLRQLIFGGATRHILAHAPIPVIFAH
jgi:nucleotide-binding universal stress UspA family protein